MTTKLFYLHWFAVRPTPYNDFLFRKLSADPEINLTVHFINSASESHPWQTPMAQGFSSRHYQKFLGVDWQCIKLAVKDKKSFFVIAGWDEMVRQAIINLLMFRGRPFAIWTDTPNLNASRHLLKRVLRSNWLKMVFRRSAAVMGTGTLGIETLERMDCPKEKIINFPYWTYLPKDWDDNKKSSNRDSIIFFSVGRLNVVKGYDLAIKALREVFRSYRKEKIAYWIFGDGPERTTLEALAKQMGIAEIVKFWGWQEPELIQKEIKKADIFVHPALWEPYGVAVLEAMAHGKLVIASDRTMAAVDRLTHGINGFIHKTGNVEEIANQMMFFIENPDKIDRMGREARRIAEEWPVERGVEIIKGLARQVLL